MDRGMKVDTSEVTPEEVEEVTISRILHALEEFRVRNGCYPEHFNEYKSIIQNLDRQYGPLSEIKKSCDTCITDVGKCYKTIACFRGKYSEWMLRPSLKKVIKEK